jgi:aminopeptidase N
MRVKSTAAIAALALLATLATGCDGGSPAPGPGPGPAYDQWDQAVSTPREDSYYPRQGDPRIDTLHYGLDLAWDPRRKRLTGKADIAFRVPRDSGTVQLDLIPQLRVSAVTLDGKPADFAHPGKDLRILGTFAKDSDHTVRVEYAGSPGPVPAPTTRRDFSTIGWNTLPDGEVWSMQEPFGSYTWYPSNDQPADKAFYDFTIRVPKRWVGVANGELTADRVHGTTRVMNWHLSHPAATYLTTIAIGDYVRTQRKSASGVPIDFWTRRGDRRAIRSLAVAPALMGWLEKRLGPYPFATLGFLIVPSRSGMETQTMITLGNTDYTRSPEVIEHEMTHQWYGDLVTPTDWRDVWMNEGMTMFIQIVYEAQRAGITIDQRVEQYAPFEQLSRAENGPPGAYARGTFGEGNIYYSPALMWNKLRHQLGDQRFWEMVRAWPQQHAYGNATRAEYYRWLHDTYGVDTGFLDDWIMGRTTP